MMKKLLAGIFLLTHILAHGQYMPLNFGARISVTSVTPTAPHTYRITGLVQDNLSKWNASDVQASQDSVYHLGGSNLYNYRISSIQSAAGNSITMTLVDQDSTGDYPSTGTEWAVVKFTPANKFPYWLSGVSDNLNSAIQNRFVQRLDESLQGGVNGVSPGEMLVWDSLAQLWVRTPFVRSNISNGNTAIGGIAPTTNKLDVSGTIGINSMQALRLASTNAVYGNSPATFTNGTNNLVVGIGAGSAMTGADESTIVGQAAGASITSGNGNTLLGYSAGNALFGGYDNTLIGRNSGKLITQGYYNIAVGQNSMANADNPTHSIAIGKDALSNTYYTRHNIAIGTDAGRKLNNNNNNLYSEYSIYLGSYTSSFADSCQKEIVIGYQAESIGSNSAVLGSQLWTDSTALFGQLKLVDYTGTNYNNTNPGHLLVTNSTGYVGKIPVSSLSNIVRDTCFSVNIINGGADQTLWVCANGTGITAAYNNGELQIIAPNTSVNVKSADFKFGAATVQSTPDAGGATNWVRVKFTQTKGNTGYSDIRVPVVQKVALPETGSLGLANAASVDIDNNPNVSVVECGFNMIMLRVADIVAGGNGYLLKFTGVH